MHLVNSLKGESNNFTDNSYILIVTILVTIGSLVKSQ